MLLSQKILYPFPQRLDGQQFVLGLRQNDHGCAQRRGTRSLHIGSALPLFGTQVEQQDIRWIAGETLGGKIEVRDVRNMKLARILRVQYPAKLAGIFRFPY